MMADGKWQMADGKWQMADGQLDAAVGDGSTAISHQPSAVNDLPLAISHQTSAISDQPSAFGDEPSATGQPSAIRIVAFCCHYCAYAAADLAGSLRLQYPPSVRVVKLPCTGKLDIQLVLDAFEAGADGVMVAGCMEGDCHFQVGNLGARRRVERAQELLRQIGLQPERVRMFNMSSAMGNKWAEAVAEMDEAVRRLGPSPLRSAASSQSSVASRQM